MPKKTYYVTTAVDYPNAKPHIGHAYEKAIADLLARWHELKGEDVFYLTGTDEHGQKIERSAKKAGKTPKKFVDEMSSYFQLLCQKLNLRINNFIRTTEKKHAKTSQIIFTKAFDKGLIYKGKYSGLYCTGCEAFYTEKDLKDGLCPEHLREPEELSEESYFFKMSEFQDRLVKHIEQHPDFIQPASKRKEILNRLKDPLKDLSVSRTTFKWGIAVPQDKKHIIYVWFDALLNYLSGVGYPTRKYEKYWPANCQVVGKGITWFHTVIWPTMLMAADVPLPKSVYSHGYLTVDGMKMSKSLGNVVDPIEVVDKYGADPLRYVLLRDVPAGDDGDFSEQNLISRNNGDLADSLGNLLQRTSSLIHKHFHGHIPVLGKLTDKEKDLNNAIPNMNELNRLMDEYEWNKVIEAIWYYIGKCNKYINDAEPWKQTNDAERLATILYTVAEHLRIISILIWPIIPESAEKLSEQLGQPLGKFKDVKFKKTTKGVLLEPKILFEKLELPEEHILSSLNIKVGKITKVEHHPEADKLFILEVDAGSEKRQIVSGTRDFYKADELLNKTVLFLSNLKPAKIRGKESQGMVLTFEKGDLVKVVEVDAKPGDQVFAESVKPSRKQITFKEFEKVKLKIQNKNIVYEDKKLRTSSGIIEVDAPEGADVV